MKIKKLKDIEFVTVLNFIIGIINLILLLNLK